jgi:hypothetical protein
LPRRFENHCRSDFDGDYSRYRDCFSDEHYFPTLLATHGLSNETDCEAMGVVAADWSRGGKFVIAALLSGCLCPTVDAASTLLCVYVRGPTPTTGAHPHAFEAEEVLPELFKAKLREESSECNATAAQHSAAQTFVHVDALAGRRQWQVWPLAASISIYLLLLLLYPWNSLCLSFCLEWCIKVTPNDMLQVSGVRTPITRLYPYEDQVPPHRPQVY